MATQLKPSDFTYAAQTRRPNIRVVFNAGPAALAVREKADQLPADIRDATLDEITSDPFVEWDAVCEAFDEAKAAQTAYFETTMQPANLLHKQVKANGLDPKAAFAYVQHCEEEYGLLGSAVMQAARCLAMVPAPDAAALAFKIKVLTDEEYHLCTGFDDAPEALARDAEAVLAVPTNPFMRGPMIAWERGYANFITARVERERYERNYFNPAGANVTDEMQDHYNDLVTIEGEALERLLKLTAPSPAELGVKLKLVAEGEEWRLAQDTSITAKIAADARRFGRHGAYLQGDAKLLAALAETKKERRSWLPSVDAAISDDDYDLSVQRSVAAEQIVWGERASTLEGVLAKLICLFPQMQQELWSEFAITDPSHHSFQPGIDAADGNFRVLWAAIEDLARIAGVNLAELGA